MSQQRIEKWDEVNGSADPQEKLSAFLDSVTDVYSILQLRRIPETFDVSFESLDRLRHMGKEPEFDHYEVVYTGNLPPYTNQSVMLEQLYMKFNIDHPFDFRGHSLSVSDIVALKTAGVVSCHYVDSFGFKELPGFMKPENYLKNAEMAMEDDYGMIDGVINNGKSAAIVERKSVLQQLKDTPAAEAPRRPSRRSKERDLE